MPLLSLRFRRLLAPSAALFVAAGCGPQGVQKITIDGTVSYQGKPLPSGMMKFTGENGFYSAATVQSDGSFIITDVVPGEIKVGITEAPQGSGDSSGKTAATALPSVSLPAKYREPETSGLKYTVTPDTKTLRIDIP